MSGVHIKSGGGFRKRHITQRECHVRMPQRQGKASGKHQNLGERQGTNSPSQSSKEPTLHTLILNFSPPEL